MSDLDSGLYLVSTPIGHARDITLRAIDVLRDASQIVAEDTRSLQRLLTIHGINLNQRQLISYHDFSSKNKLQTIIREIKSGLSIAMVSEAGTPLISDPGFKLVNEAIRHQLPVIPIPGPTAPITALTISGLGSDQFHFVGFLPTTSAKRRKTLEQMKFAGATLIFFESPNRLYKSLCDMEEVFGADRKVAICRELTKRYEETTRGTIMQQKNNYQGRIVKGEVVIVVERNQNVGFEENIDEILALALTHKSLKEAVREVSETLGLSRKSVYQKALMLTKGQ